MHDEKSDRLSARSLWHVVFSYGFSLPENTCLLLWVKTIPVEYPCQQSFQCNPTYQNNLCPCRTYATCNTHRKTVEPKRFPIYTNLDKKIEEATVLTPLSQVKGNITRVRSNNLNLYLHKCTLESTGTFYRRLQHPPLYISMQLNHLKSVYYMDTVLFTDDFQMPSGGRNLAFSFALSTDGIRREICGEAGEQTNAAATMDRDSLTQQ